MRYEIILLILFSCMTVACDQVVPDDEGGIVGAWQITKIARQDGSEPPIEGVLPSQFMFTESHYSMVWQLGDEPRRAFAERWSPTDAEKLRRYDSLVVNSGRYEINGTTVTVFPTVARVPEFIGGRLECEFHVAGETLSLRFLDEYSFDGVQAPWAATGSGFILTLTRVDRE